MVQCNLIGDGRYKSLRVGAKFVTTPLTFLCWQRSYHLTLRFREKILSFVGSSHHLSNIFVTEVLSWLTAEGPRLRNSRSSSLHIHDQGVPELSMAADTLRINFASFLRYTILNTCLVLPVTPRVMGRPNRQYKQQRAWSGSPLLSNNVSTLV